MTGQVKTPEEDRPEPETDGEIVFLPPREVARRTGLCTKTISRRVDSGDFPKPVNLGGRRVAFVESEVEAWQKSLMEARE